MIFESPLIPATPDGYIDRPYQALFRVELAAGGVANVPCQFDSDTGTIVRSIRGESYLVGIPEVRLRDQSGEEFQSGFMAFEAFADLQQHGAAVFPAIVIPPNGQLIIEAREVTGTDAADFVVVFQGVKRYRQ